MRVFAISDLHLSFAADKPMDLFGEAWRDHVERLVGRMAGDRARGRPGVDPG